MLLNRERAEEKMDEHGFDALIATSSANVFYFSDCYPYGNSFAILPRERDIEPILIAPISGTTPVVLMSPPWFKESRFYGEFYVYTEFAEEPITEAERRLIEAQNEWKKNRENNPYKILAEEIMEKGFRGKIGIDNSNLNHKEMLVSEMNSKISRLDVVFNDQIFKDIRMVKSDEEIKRIGKSVDITEKAWNRSLEEIEEASTERLFADIFQREILAEGGHNFSYLGTYWPPVAFGRRTAFSDIAQPSRYKLKYGDIIRFDGGCTYQGYPCDMARTAAFGKASTKLKKYWKAIYRGEQAIIDMVKPGVAPSKLFDLAIEVVRETGIEHYNRHHTGHGWGIEGYDPPTLGPHDDTKLEEGMVLCIETPYYEVGWGGILHEDVIVVTKDYHRYISTPESDLRVV